MFSKKLMLCSCGHSSSCFSLVLLLALLLVLSAALETVFLRVPVPVSWLLLCLCLCVLASRTLAATLARHATTSTGSSFFRYKAYNDSMAFCTLCSRSCKCTHRPATGELGASSG
jgi:divalent metal cation (Fe/Co/Zn/Cd) transporter